MSPEDNGPSWAGAGIASFAAIAPQRNDENAQPCRGCDEFGPIEHRHDDEPGPGEIGACG